MCSYICSTVSFGAVFLLALTLLNLPGNLYSFFYYFLPLHHHPSFIQVRFTLVQIISLAPTPLPWASTFLQWGQPGWCGLKASTPQMMCHLWSAHGYLTSSCTPSTQGEHKLFTRKIRGLEGEMLIAFRSFGSPSWLTSHMEEVYVKLMFTGSALSSIIPC